MRLVIILFLGASVLGKLYPVESNLAGTTWLLKVSPDCFDTLKLMHNYKVSEYDCEINYKFHGSYKIIKNELLLTMIDDSHSEDGNRPVYIREKYLIKSNFLYFIGNGQLVKGKWVYENLQKPASVRYLRMINKK